METNNSIPMLELMLRPGFCVSDGIITKINQAAAAYLLREGDPIVPMLATGKEEYSTLTDGCLYLTLSIGTQRIGANVLVLEGCHLFILEQENAQAELQSLALAAQELREPLSGMISSARHFSTQTEEDQAYSAQFHRRMYQLLRIVSNMSDAVAFRQADATWMELIEIGSYLEELLQKTAQQLQAANIHLHYTLPKQAIYTLADRSKLERAVYNMIGNAAKHTPAGGSIQFQVTHRGRLYLSVTDQGPGIAPGVKANLFDRYLRTPSITGTGEGIGLGMVLIRSVATLHGGTVLIDHPSTGGTRVTMTMELRQGGSFPLRSPILQIDYAGERDHGLQELADVLPASLYTPDYI